MWSWKQRRKIGDVNVALMCTFFLFVPKHILSRGRKCKPIFVQIARQVVKLNASDLRLPSRAWKVKLVGEGADDAGGVFDDTITEMCQVQTRAVCSDAPAEVEMCSM